MEEMKISSRIQWLKNGDHPLDGDETFVAPSDNKTYRCEGKVVRYMTMASSTMDSVGTKSALGPS